MNQLPHTNRPQVEWLLLLCMMAFAGCAYAVVSGDHINQDKSDQIQQGIQRIRQLSFKTPVPLVLKTPDQVEQMVIKDIARDYTDEQLDADGKAGSMLGMFPPGMDLKAETVKLLKAQIAGFYDPYGKQMVLVEGAYKIGFWDRTTEFMVQRDLVGEMLLAHELTHALQDQNFALQDNLDKLRENSDQQLALKSVAEGDATLAGFAYIVGRMDNSVAETLTSHLRDLPQTFAAQSKGTPEGLSIPLIFQYSDGVHFVAEAYKRGGWGAVDALYLKPPKSTQQIIDPALYFDNPTAPVEVSVDGYAPILKDWKKVDVDTYGELSLRIVLRLGYGQGAPETALARKWAGDRMIVLKHDAEVSVIWMVAFRDADSAAKFAKVYRSMLDRERASTPHSIEQRSNLVLVVAGVAANQFKVLAPAVWKMSKAAAPQPQPIHAEHASWSPRATLLAPGFASSRESEAMSPYLR